MKNLTKQNLIIVFLVLNFISVLGLLYITNKQSKKMDRLSYDIDLKTSNSYRNQRAELDSLLFGSNK